MLIEKILLWPDRQDVGLTAYVREDSTQNSNGRKRPAVIVCPGGAYLGIASHEAEPVALAFAARGYQAFVLQYSTFFRGSMGNVPASPSPADLSNGNPHAAYPGPLLDLAKAFLAIRANCSRWLTDPERIAVCGFSAGGHLAASFGISWHEPFIAGKVGADSLELQPAALILGYPLTDFRVMKRAMLMANDSKPDMLAYWQLSCLAIFKSAEPADEELAALSPVNRVSRLMPPTFIWHTADDAVVPVANSLNLAAALSAQGIPFELHVFEKGVHGLSLADDASAANASQVNEPLQIWLTLAVKWLKSRLPVFFSEMP